MDAADIQRLYRLWAEIYPYLAKQVVALLPEEARNLLEVGPFSGGMAFELARAKGESTIVIADRHHEILDFLACEAESRGLGGRIEWVQSDPAALAFGEATFDGVVFRGAFFFLDASMLKEIYHVLRPGGVGLVGGGYGGSTPERLIEAIASESRRLNARLGKRWISRDELEEMIREAGLEEAARIVEEGGLWVVMEG